MTAAIALSLLGTLAATSQESGAYADTSTATLIATARAAHARRDDSLMDYSATVFTRIDLSESRGRFTRSQPLGAVEYASHLEWHRSGQVRLEYRGLRKQYAFQMMPGPIPFFDIDQSDLDDPRIDEPWVLPHTLGDHVRVICCDFQARAVVHPLAQDGDQLYQFAITDSVSLDLGHRTLNLIAVNVVPRTDTAAVMVGRMWIERESGNVVRLVVRLLGDRLFDSNEHSLLNRVFRLELDVEYALVEDFWLPARQYVTLEAHDDLITGTVMPLRFQMTFSDYAINRAPAQPAASVSPRVRLDTVQTDDPELQDALNVVRAARQPDGAGGIRLWVDDMDALVRAIQTLERAGIESGLRVNDGSAQTGEAFSARTRIDGQQWTVSSPPAESLLTYSAWETPLQLTGDAASQSNWLGARAVVDSVIRQLPDSVRVAGFSGTIRLGDAVRFNRVHGVHFGASYARAATSGVFRLTAASTRFGLSDRRATFMMGVERGGPSTSLTIRAFHRIADAGPFSDGASIGNTINTILTGHDDADYHMTSGGELTITHLFGSSSSWRLSVGGERHGSVTAKHYGGIFGSDRRPNPGATDGTFAVVRAGLDGRNLHWEWQTEVEALASQDRVTGRWWGTVEAHRGPLRIEAKLGLAPAGAIDQMQFRAGGPYTVRGHPYGRRTGPVLWAAQSELALPSVLGIRPYVFGDAADATTLERTFGETPLVGVGLGLAVPLVIAEVRIEASRSVVQKDAAAPLRFDLRIR